MAGRKTGSADKPAAERPEPPAMSGEGHQKVRKITVEKFLRDRRDIRPEIVTILVRRDRGQWHTEEEWSRRLVELTG